MAQDKIAFWIIRSKFFKISLVANWKVSIILLFTNLENSLAVMPYELETHAKGLYTSVLNHFSKENYAEALELYE